MILEVKEVLTKYTMSEDVNKKAVRNRHPDAVSHCYIRMDSNKKWVTGYTPGYYDKSVEKQLEEERKELEEVANIRFDINDPNDPFLSLLTIERALPGNKLAYYDTDTPLGLFKVRAALANGFIADKKENVGVGKFAYTTYYFQSRELEDKKEKEVSKLRLLAGRCLVNNESERAWLVIQCFLHGMIVKESYSNETLYGYLANKLEACKTAKELESLLKQFERKGSDIESSFIAKQAVDLKIVTWDTLSLTYVYKNEKVTDGAIVLGSTIKEVESYLNQKTKQEAYGHIRKEVFKRYKIS